MAPARYSRSRRLAAQLPIRQCPASASAVHSRPSITTVTRAGMTHSTGPSVASRAARSARYAHTSS